VRDAGCPSGPYVPGSGERKGSVGSLYSGLVVITAVVLAFVAVATLALR
jgi:hypothetical protein